MMRYKHQIRDRYKFYSQDLLNNLFKHPYTKIEFVVNDLKVSRITAANYLNKLASVYIKLPKPALTRKMYLRPPCRQDPTQHSGRTPRNRGGDFPILPM